MSLRQGDIVIDCADHDVVAPFWQAALGWERQEVNAQYVALIAPADELEAAGQRPLPMLFQKVPSRRSGRTECTSIFGRATASLRWRGSWRSARGREGRAASALPPGP